MNAPNSFPLAFACEYADRLQSVLSTTDWSPVATLAHELHDCWGDRRQVFLCGNGGSAGNAMHLANDLLYGITRTYGSGMRVTALPANSSVLTCLANDENYDDIFSFQLGVLAQPGDILVALSGSGNSPNIIKAIATAKDVGMRTYAILGFSGGKAKDLVDVPIHFPIHDMQISEDLQLIVGHMVMQWLYRRCSPQCN